MCRRKVREEETSKVVGERKQGPRDRAFVSINWIHLNRDNRVAMTHILTSHRERLTVKITQFTSWFGRYMY